MTIYLDYQATTPLAPEALAAMQPWLAEKFANPHSPHRPGREAAAAVEVARQQVVSAIRAAGDCFGLKGGNDEPIEGARAVALPITAHRRSALPHSGRGA